MKKIEYLKLLLLAFLLCAFAFSLTYFSESSESSVCHNYSKCVQTCKESGLYWDFCDDFCDDFDVNFTKFEIKENGRNG